MAARNREIFDKVNATFARGDIQGFLDYCADDVVWTMVGDQTTKGKQAIGEWMRSMPQHEPPVFTTDMVLEDGDRLCATGDMTMKEQDGSVGRYSYCDVYRFRDGQIAELRAFVVKLKA